MRYKPKVRKSYDIHCGTAKVFAHLSGEGLYGWTLPGGRFTMIEEEARVMAQRMDAEIRYRCSKLGDFGERFVKRAEAAK